MHPSTDYGTISTPASLETAPAPLFTPHRSRTGVLEPRKILHNLALTSAIDDGKEENVHRQEEAAGEEK